MNSQDLTPLMRQYRDIKHAYKEAILFFRVGDFYEMFFDDAEEAAGILNIALTSREKNSPNPVPLCGVPHHAATGYIAKLLKVGRTVALCEQVEDPKLAKGLVRREVVRLYTPGTVFDDDLLEAKQSNFLTALSGLESDSMGHSLFGVAAVDLSTGEFSISELSGNKAREDLFDELIRISPQELIHSQDLSSELVTALCRLPLPRLVSSHPSWFDPQDSLHLLRTQFRVPDVKEWKFDYPQVSIPAAGAVLRYLRETQPLIDHRHIQKPKVRHSHHEMHLDSMTIRNLELIRSMTGASDGPTLFSILDHTVTTMGSRVLRQWIIRPLLDASSIKARLEAVTELIENLNLRRNLRTALKSVQDLERLSSRISMGTASPREVLGLKESLEPLPGIDSLLQMSSSHFLRTLWSGWDNLQDLWSTIDQTLKPEAPSSIREGGIIRDGVDSQLDELRKISRDGTQWLADLEYRERQRTGIESLKIKFNQVFGYYIEVTKANLSKIPGDFIRKQTLANVERFTSDQLKVLEEQVTGANQKIHARELELFSNLRTTIGAQISRIQDMAGRLAILDVMTSLAEAAVLNRYVRPDIDEGGIISITEGRHPVVEKMNPPGGFIPNDTQLNLDTHRLLLITGPNMAGKSTYLRQTGLIILLAQMGSFVPASAAHIGVVDRIFTRVGASDNLAGGESTFMVEMSETGRILEAATGRSLVLLDEIGRGTSTYDGLSIAWAVAEYIQDRTLLGARTLFATHYHEMTTLEDLRGGIKNYTVSVKEDNEEIIFLRKIIPGKANRSYGIHVATLAGLPKQVIQRAQEVLTQLEQADTPQQPTHPTSSPLQTWDHPTPNPLLLPLPHPIIEEMKQMDLFSLTPLEAMNKLANFQQRLEEEA